MIEEVLFELFDNLKSVDPRANGDDKFFTQVCDRFDLTNMAYLGVNLPVKNNQQYFVHNTYSREWARRYETQNYVSIDPIVRRGMTSLMPIDWQQLGSLTPIQKKLLGESAEHKVGRHGLTFPLHGLHGETAVLSVTSDLSERDWRDFKRQNLRNMRILGDVFHQRVVDASLDKAGHVEPTLTRREAECLKWSGEGKTQQDISEILGITPRTVRFFLEGARQKLGCLNTTHAVTSAMLRGLI